MLVFGDFAHVIDGRDAQLDKCVRKGCEALLADSVMVMRLWIEHLHCVPVRGRPSTRTFMVVLDYGGI